METIKRQLTKRIIFEPAKSRIENNQCPSCGLPKNKWKRRKDWRCCSVECTDKWYKLYVTYDWAGLRIKALKRDKWTCVKCGDNKKEVEVEVKIKECVNMMEFITLNEKFKYQRRIMKQMRTNLIGDHIIPIAIGGDEFDLNNIQTLCLKCNKIKTKQDMKDIALYRKQSKYQEKL